MKEAVMVEETMKLAEVKAQKHWHRPAVVEAEHSMMAQKHWVMEQVKLPRKNRAHQTNQLRFQLWSDLPIMMDYFLPVVPDPSRTADC
jgi:type II secretory pathway component PulJ